MKESDNGSKLCTSVGRRVIRIYNEQKIAKGLKISYYYVLSSQFKNI